jgi:hypothetical protein
VNGDIISIKTVVDDVDSSCRKLSSIVLDVNYNWTMTDEAAVDDSDAKEMF